MTYSWKYSKNYNESLRKSAEKIKYHKIREKNINMCLFWILAFLSFLNKFWNRRCKKGHGGVCKVDSWKQFKIGKILKQKKNKIRKKC